MSNKQMATKKFDCLFITEPSDSLKCPICLEVAREARQHGHCGKLFCKECVESNSDQPCPICRAPNPSYFPDRRSDREIGELAVRCCHVNRGCTWEGVVATLEKHMDNCEFTLISCPSECVKDKDGDLPSKHILKKDLKDHLALHCPNRTVQCKDCRIDGKYSYISGKHKNDCVEKFVVCSNVGCTDSFKQKMSESHSKICKYEEVSCKYDVFGCPVKKRRKEITKHENENDEFHLNYGIDKVKKLKKIISDLDKTVSDMQKAMNEKVLQKGEHFIFKVNEYCLLKERDKCFLSKSFYTYPVGYRMCIAVYPNGNEMDKGTHLAVYARILKGSFDDNLSWPFLGSVTLELLNQCSDRDHISKIIEFGETDKTYPGDGWGFPKFISHSILLCSDVSKQYLVNDSLYFRIKVQHKKPWLVE